MDERITIDDLYELPEEELDKRLDEADSLVPESGPAETLQGEILRAARKIEYRWYNDGDRINPDGTVSGTFCIRRTCGFLRGITRIAAAREDAEWQDIAGLRQMLERLASAQTAEEYKMHLWDMVIEARTIACTRPLIPNEWDMLDERWEA